MLRKSICTAAAALLLIGAAQAATASTDPALAAAIAGDWRTPQAKARDQYRRPLEALTFWGLKPGMTILEVQPGAASWWTEILAPYARATNGTFYATGADLDDPQLPEGARKAREAFEQRYNSKPELYGKVHVVNWGPRSKPLPENKFDFILTARSVHGWMNSGWAEKAFTDLARALKPGGILALEQHRANPGANQDGKAPTGYVTEEYVIALAKKAGLELEDRSEINANPKDTKDHPFGVWTLPPTRQTAPIGQPP
ncbi:MAG TPA: methyltransferase domain-containing protein, partial [Steroidobacteraceae bacterium]